MANGIKDLKSEETKSCSEKHDAIIIAESYIDEEEGAIPPHIYLLSFKLLQKEQQKDKISLEALKSLRQNMASIFFRGQTKVEV
eukprot:1750059-Ditylum_brightwellii.AAC.1